MLRGRILVVGMLFLAGCSGSRSDLPATYPVTGQVVDARGAPLRGGTVQLETSWFSDLTAVGVIREDGTFIVKTYRDEVEVSGAPEGEYQITISPPQEADNASPQPVTLLRPYRVQPRENTFRLRLVE